MNPTPPNTRNGFFLILFILFGCAATTLPHAASEPVRESVPGQWVNTSEVKDPIEPPASLTVKGPTSTDEIRYENCENSDEIVSVGPPTSEVGVAVPLEHDGTSKHAYAFSRHFCKTDLHD